MLRAQPDPFRIALFVSLGLAGCGGRVAGVETTNQDTNAGGQGQVASTGAGASNVDPVGTAGDGTGGASVTPVDLPEVVTPPPPSNPVVENLPLGLSGRCNESSPIVTDGIPTGLYECDTGVVHRPEPVVCLAQPSTNPVAADAGAPSASAPSEGSCAADSDCTDARYGMCRSDDGGPWGGLQCVYGCLSDSDCDANELCQCGAPYGTCAQATCTSDADCTGDALCAQVLTSVPICSAPLGFACQVPEDQCNTNQDCTGGTFCVLSESKRHCEGSNAVCGRPFLVAGAHRQASAARSDEWSCSLPGRVQADSALRGELAHAWTRIGLMEHASIAAFARFALQLLQLGAPPSLIDSTTEAMADETRHARLAFELASRYAGQPVGPTAIDVTGALGASDLRDIVRITIEEGCIGETIAAMEAAEAAAHCEDYAVRQVLERIRQDELRHAELAWRFVQWAIDQGDDSLRQDITETFTALLARDPGRTSEPTSHDAELLRHGVVSAGVSRSVRYTALRDVVGPCAQALLGGRSLERRAA